MMSLIYLSATFSFKVFAAEWKGTNKVNGTDCEFIYRSIPSGIAVGRFFDLEIEFINGGLCQGLILKTYDLTMPNHKHGMIVKILPVTTVTKSKFILKNLKAHMPGKWELKIEFQRQSATIVTKFWMPNLL